MPVYSFRCTLCTHYFEEEKSIRDYVNEPELKVCPSCGRSMKPSRIINLSTVIYKGDGFYSTDNRKSEDVHSSESG